MRAPTNPPKQWSPQPAVRAKSRLFRLRDKEGGIGRQRSPLLGRRRPRLRLLLESALHRAVVVQRVRRHRLERRCVVNLGEEQPEHALPILPCQVTNVNMLVGRGGQVGRARGGGERGEAAPVAHVGTLLLCSPPVDLPLDVLYGVEKEGLDLVALLQDDGRQPLDVPQLLGLQSHQLPQPRRIELGLSNLLAVGLSDGILLSLKLAHGVGERALEGLDLGAQLLDLLRLPEALLRVLLDRLLVELHLAPQLLVLFLERPFALLELVRLLHL
mmetsp:Transcript_30344/g.74724  ORF Transcript_30344/g.74724 Transcript_30344/m.74724 type:complete len:272 (-) Transcript_30344:661-1476(-)